MSNPHYLILWVFAWKNVKQFTGWNGHDPPVPPWNIQHVHIVLQFVPLVHHVLPQWLEVILDGISQGWAPGELAEFGSTNPSAGPLGQSGECQPGTISHHIIFNTTDAVAEMRCFVGAMIPVYVSNAHPISPLFGKVEEWFPQSALSLQTMFSPAMFSGTCLGHEIKCLQIEQ